MYSNIVETSQKPKTELSAKTVNGFDCLTVFAKSPSQVSGEFHLRPDIYTYVYKYIRATCQNIFHIKLTLTRRVRKSVHGQFVQLHFFILSLNIKKRSTP